MLCNNLDQVVGQWQQEIQESPNKHHRNDFDPINEAGRIDALTQCAKDLEDCLNKVLTSIE